MIFLVGKDSPDKLWKRKLVSTHKSYMPLLAQIRHTSVVHLAIARVDGLEQLVDLLFCHLLTQVCQDVLELTNADEASHVLIKHLETAAVFLGLAWVTEAAWPVQDALEGLEVDCANYAVRTRSRNLETRGA